METQGVTQQIAWRLNRTTMTAVAPSLDRPTCVDPILPLARTPTLGIRPSCARHRVFPLSRTQLQTPCDGRRFRRSVPWAACRFSTSDRRCSRQQNRIGELGLEVQITVMDARIQLPVAVSDFERQAAAGNRSVVAESSLISVGWITQNS